MQLHWRALGGWGLGYVCREDAYARARDLPSNHADPPRLSGVHDVCRHLLLGRSYTARMRREIPPKNRYHFTRECSSRPERSSPDNGILSSARPVPEPSYCLLDSSWHHRKTSPTQRYRADDGRIDVLFGKVRVGSWRRRLCSSGQAFHEGSLGLWRERPCPII